MASATVKDVDKSLNTAFAGSTNLPHLPDEVVSVLETFLAKQVDIEDHDSQKLHEDLLNIHSKYIAKEKGRLSAFLQALKILRPAIKGQSRLLEWWKTVLEPILDSIAHKRVEVENVSDFLIGILDYNAETSSDGEREKESSSFCILLLNIYLKRTRVVGPDRQSLNVEDEFIANQVESILISFGRRRPKDFMLALDNLVVVKTSRMQALSLLCAFCRHQPPHLHTIATTPLLEHLLKCLMIDTSTTVLSLALSTLIMFLPHIPNSVITHLPRLFIIYSRLLCWERSRPPRSEDETTPAVAEEEEGDAMQPKTEAEADTKDGWDKLSASFETTASSPPGLMYYFTFLYGLYPLNFINYLRKPRKYLLNIDFPGIDELDLDQALIRSRTEQFRSLHVLHPNFYHTSIEDELTDNRWLKSDPSDVVAECMGLYINAPVNLAPPVPPPKKRLPEVPHSAEDDYIQEQPLLGRDDDATTLANTPSTASEAVSSEWQLPPSLNLNEKQADPEEALQKGTPPHSPPGTARAAKVDVIATSTQDYGDDSPTLPAADARPKSRDSSVLRREETVRDRLVQTPKTIIARSQASRAAPKIEANLAYLQREVMLLRNDLNFERYLKQQHLSHIGQLQRRHINEATVEAETQNLINTNKSLKAKLAKSNEAYNSLKKETATGRNQAKKWETELSAKVRNLREEERRLRTELDTLTIELGRVREESTHLRRLFTESEARELLSQQKVASMALDLEQLEALRKRADELESKIKEFEAKDLQHQKADEERATLRTELETAKLHVESRDAGLERTKNNYDAKIQDLEARLLAAQNPKPDQAGQMAPYVQHMIESAVASINTKYAALKSEHATLKHQFVELEMQCKDLERDSPYVVGSLAISQGYNTTIRPPLPENAIAETFRTPTGYAASVPGTSLQLPFPTEHDLNHPFRRGSEQSPLTASSSFLSFAPSSAPVSNQPLLSGGIPSSNPLSLDLASAMTGSIAGDSTNSRTESDVRSAFSDSNDSDENGNKGKTKPRVYGRGGAQNSGMSKAKEEEKKATKSPKPGSLKSGGFRGLRAIK